MPGPPLLPLPPPQPRTSPVAITSKSARELRALHRRREMSGIIRSESAASPLSMVWLERAILLPVETFVATVTLKAIGPSAVTFRVAGAACRWSWQEPRCR